jgi:hypothetical protein
VALIDGRDAGDSPAGAVDHFVGHVWRDAERAAMPDTQVRR